MNQVVKNIQRSRKQEDLHNVFWKAFRNKKCKKDCGSSLKVVILNAPCNGFGDLIFALKLSKYIQEWYNATVTIATPLEQGLLKLGADPNRVIGLVNKNGTTTRAQCRLFARFKFNKDLEPQDLIFVGPMTVDFDPDMSDVKKLLPYANIINTFFFSEYNDEMDKGFDFNTGIGHKRDGILLTKPKIEASVHPKIHYPYTVAYLFPLDDVEGCLGKFAEMIAKKYSHKNLELVVPNWYKKPTNALVKRLNKYFRTINITTGKGTKVLMDKDKDQSGVSFTFRADILPVPNEQMLQLFKHSLNDILVTGDQSMTDALSCCANKNIFYQIVPWKHDFAKNLKTLMPNKYYKSPKTSCGIKKAEKYKSNYKKFVKRYGFANLGKQKLDAIILSAVAIQTDPELSEIARNVTSKRLEAIKKYFQ